MGTLFEAEKRFHSSKYLYPKRIKSPKIKHHLDIFLIFIFSTEGIKGEKNCADGNLGSENIIISMILKIKIKILVIITMTR